jgi:cyclopropane-fatty-acyl-phospholipid synthase
MGLAEVFEAIAGPGAPVEFQAYDGSSAGVIGSPIKLTIRSPVAVSYLAQAPGALGLARAYVSGHLDLEGNMFTALSRLSKAQDSQVSLSERIKLLQALGGPKVLVPRIAPPPQEVQPNRRRLTIGRMHSKRRDASSISHHYDVSNRFYEWVLGPTMAYTCACYPTENATLEEAQAYKFDLVARKIALKPGMRLLDVGCGWGGMVMHAAREHGAYAVGVTLSTRQAEWAREAVREAGLADRVDIRVQDYRDVADAPFDAISSIGMFEHVGVARLDEYFQRLFSLLRPGGRLLNHGIAKRPGPRAAFAHRGFIDRYVFPDGELHEVGSVVTRVQRAGFEARNVEGLREHYAQTLRHWVANLEAHWDDAVRLVGPGRARVWRLYMAASACNFEAERNQIHQVLAVRNEPDGRSHMPLRPDWEPYG